MPDRTTRYRAWLASLEARRLDGFLVTKPVNLDYLFNFSGSTGMALLLAGETCLLVDSRYIEQAGRSAVNCRPVLAEQSLWATLRTILRNRARTPASPHIGLESAHLSHHAAQELKSWRSGVRWVPTVSLIERLRMIKEDAEIRLLRKAFRIAQLAFQRLRAAIRPGMTESEVAGLLEFELRQAGGQGLSFETIVASGRRSSLPHATVTARRIGATRPVLIDFGTRYSSYCSDLTRMHFFPEARLPRIHAIVQEAQQAALDVIRPGIPAGRVDAAARQVIARQGFGEFFGHATGHGLGLEVHELPRISASGEELLEPGMVFTVEPGIYLPDRHGIRIEDAVLVTRKGCRLLSSRDL